MAVDTTIPILIADYNTMIRVIRNLLRQPGFAHRRGERRHDGARQDAQVQLGADDGLRPAAGSAQGSQPVDDAVHHGDGQSAAAARRG
jgi:hypothetical protein